jgi:hypothetical protein
LKPVRKRLLIVDAFVNLVLGILLLSFPIGTAPWLGVPFSGSSFYPTILGGVLFGIGAALLLEAYGKPEGSGGLALTGAIAINFCGAGVLCLWLLFSPLHLPLRGYLILWTIALAVLSLGAVELISRPWKGE